MAILMFPENPTGLFALISNSVSVDNTDHVDSSITNVNDPPARFWFVIVRLTGVGVGE
jgi:hypothetical protein